MEDDSGAAKEKLVAPRLGAESNEDSKPPVFPEPIVGNEGAKGAGYPIAAGGIGAAGEGAVVVPNPQNLRDGDSSFVEAHRKYKV